MIALAPEQLRALRYLRTRGTAATPASVRQRLRTTFHQLDELLCAIPEALVRRQPAPGQWSVLQVVDHLVVSNRMGLAQLTCLVEGRVPEGGPVPAGLLSDDPHARDWSATRAEIRRIHDELLATFDRGDESTSLDVRAPVVMVVKRDGGQDSPPYEWMEDLDWKAFALFARVHVLEHFQQIERILDTLRRTSKDPTDDRDSGPSRHAAAGASESGRVWRPS